MRRSAALGRTLLAALFRSGRAAGYIGLTPSYSTHNLGDSAMLGIFERELAPVRLFPSMKYRRVERRAWKAACRRSFSACILGGGTLLFWRHFYDYLSEALDAGVPCYVLGTGVNSPEFWRKHSPAFLFSPERSVEALRACRFVGVRGPLSQRILREAGLEGAEVVGDPCLLLARREPAGITSGPPALGVNWGTGRGSVWGGDERKPAAELARAARILVEKGWRLRIYCVWPDDRRAVEEFTAMLPDDSFSRADYYLRAEAFMDDVARCSAFVGLKLHATALALGAGVPSVMLGYRPKCLDFMDSVGLGEHIVRLDQLRAGDLAARVRALRERGGEQHEVFTTNAGKLGTAFRDALASVKREVCRDD